MFPLITGLLTYDTPYNGLARSMFAYGAFSQYQNVSALYNIWSSLSGGLGLASASSAAGSIAQARAEKVPGNKEMKRAVRTVGGVPASSWRRWGVLAARTGTLGAVLAGGVTAYVLVYSLPFVRLAKANCPMPSHREAIGQSISKIDLKAIDYDPRSYLKRENLPNMSLPRTMPSLPKGMSAPDLGTLSGLSGVSRESIGEGFAWMAGHLKFVGALMKQTQMSARLDRLSELQGLGRCNIFTCLGENGVWTGGYFVPRRRFCAVPIALDPELKKKGDDEKEGEAKEWWIENVNSKAENEIVSHCSMFQRDRNDGYEALLELSGKKIVGWVLGADLREVVDGYIPDELRAAKSHEEGQWVDDDGKVKEVDIELENPEAEVGEKRKASVMLGEGNVTEKQDEEVEQTEEQSEEQNEDEQQLKAIISCQGLPQPEDGGISEDVLQKAMDIPLPGEEEEMLRAAAEVPLPEGDDEEKNPPGVLRRIFMKR